MTRTSLRNRPAIAAAAATALALAGGGLRAETLDLAQAMARARDQAREVIAARAHSVAGEARLDQARAHRLPRVGFSQSWIRTDSPADVFGLLLNQERFSFAEFVASDPNDPDPLSSFTSRLEIDLPLYTGGEVSTRIRQAELAMQAGGRAVERTRDEVALAAGESYLQLAQGREHVALLERSLATVDEHVALTRAYVDQGMLVGSELLRAEVERSRVADLLAAARGRAEVAQAALSYRMAADLDSDWQLVPLPDPEPLAGDLEHWLGGASGRADLAAARDLEQVAALAVDVERAARRPRVGLRGRYDLVDDRLFGTNGDNAAIMAVATVDLFAGGRHRAARAAAAAEADAAQADVERFAEGVRLEIRKAFDEAEVARERHATARAAVGAATETERILEERFRQGVVKTIDLLDAVTARREAETRELVARTDAHLSALRLALAAGRRPEATIPGQPRASRSPDASQANRPQTEPQTAPASAETTGSIAER